MTPVISGVFFFMYPNLLLMKISTLFFDVHRTLVDDQHFPKRYIWQFLQEMNIPLDRDVYDIQYREWGRRLFDWPRIHPFIPIREIHRKRLIRFYETYRVSRDVEADLNYLWEKMAACEIYPEVPKVLAKFRKNYKLGLISNADNDDPLIQILVKNGFPFDFIVTSENVGHYKPDSAMFAAALKMSGTSRKEVLLIGDSPLADIAGAHMAGWPVAWVNRSRMVLSPGIPKPDFEVENLTKLYEILV